jgi:sugar phosphate isomerase/epimerase
MARPVTLFTGQWADLSLDDLAGLAKGFGYDGLELACWGDHFDVAAATADAGYAKKNASNSRSMASSATRSARTWSARPCAT